MIQQAHNLQQQHIHVQKAMSDGPSRSEACTESFSASTLIDNLNGDESNAAAGTASLQAHCLFSVPHAGQQPLLVSLKHCSSA